MDYFQPNGAIKIKMISETNSFDEVSNIFYNRISDQVTSSILSDLTVVTVKSVTWAWPENERESKANFPIIMIMNEDADDGNEEVQYKYEQITNRISIYVAATKTETMTKLLGKIYNAIKTYKSEFREEGVTNIKLLDKDNESDEMGGLRIRKGYLTFEVTWRRNRF